MRAHPDLFDVVGLSANTDADTLRRQAAEFEPELVALESPDSPGRRLRLRATAGPGASEHLAREPVDVVLNGIVGSPVSPRPWELLEAGNRLALANKESLVAGGEWVGRALAAPTASSPWTRSTRLSSSAWKEGRGERCLAYRVGWAVLLAGEARLLEVGPEDALDHPTWRMGPKITVDSATMMNKGLEVIEAIISSTFRTTLRAASHRQSDLSAAVLFEAARWSCTPRSLTCGSR